MTAEPCAGCPFKGCPDCQWKGGSVVVAQQNSAGCGTMEAAPGCALTQLIQGPRPSDEEGLPPMVATSKTPRTTNRANGSVR